jgi:putative two-component system response regulator
VAVVDVYDALTQKRVYRPAMPEKKALGILEEGRGTHFDPRVLDCFMKILPDLHRITEAIKDEGPPKLLDMMPERKSDNANA